MAKKESKQKKEAAVKPDVENAPDPSVTNTGKREIKKVAVIGAGAMGSGIAAQLANAGIEVHMLDKNPDQPQRAIDRMKKATPATDPLNAGFMDPANARLIKTGNTDDNLKEAVENADMIIEVIIEDLGLKQGLFAEIEKYRKPDAIVTSNTSTIPLKDLVDGRGQSFKEHFVITHFFNPPRFMRLMELVSGAETKKDVTAAVRDFCDAKLGKQVVECADSPGFIGNRIGVFLLYRSIIESLDRGLNIEDVDAVLGRPMGFPKDGTYGLVDLVGIGLVPLVTKSLNRTLDPDDTFRKIYREPKLIDALLAHDRWGRNAPAGGFYRMKKNDDGSKQLQVLDLPRASKMFEEGEWDKVFGNGKNEAALEDLYKNADKRPLKAAKAGLKGPRAVFEVGDEMSDFAWTVMRDTLIYAAGLVPDVTDDITAVDAAMREGFNWKYGPFELLDKIGAEYFVKRAKKDGVEIPKTLEMAAGHPFYWKDKKGVPHRMSFDMVNDKIGYKPVKHADGVITLDDYKRKGKPLVTGVSASLWDIGDGVVCFEFHSKMNTIDPSTLKVLNDSIEFVNNSKGKYKAMVVYNDAENFSVGANLKLAEIAMKFNRMSFVDDMVYMGQSVYKALREAPFPVIGAPKGYAFGGGCEILLHCDGLQAGAETYTGLVESGVGFIPGWGGCVRYLERAQNAKGLKGGPFPAIKTAFGALMMPQFAISSSGQDAKRKLWLRPQDGVTMNQDRLLADAKNRAIDMVPGYKPPQPMTFRLPGQVAKNSLRMAIDDFYRKGDATWHDVVVGDALADTLSGGKTDIGDVITEEELLKIERKNFVALAHTEQTQKRITHMINTNKPLREKPLEQEKTMSEIRENLKDITIEDREYTGKPLQGAEKRKLNRMAKATWAMYKADGIMGYFK